MPAQTLVALQQWLLHLHIDPNYRDRAKIILMGSPIAPMFAGSLNGQGQLHGDGWQRFPASLESLLMCIAGNGIKNVLFLAGDYHRFADCTIRMRARGGAIVEARSIVTGPRVAISHIARHTRKRYRTRSHPS